MKLFIALGLAVWAAGCVTRLIPGAERIVVTNQADKIKTCELLGEVVGSSGQGGAAAGAGLESAMNEMRNKTTRLEADTLYIMHSASGYSGAQTLGQAYRCHQ